ncbi:MAG: DUF3786 domain-containing protein [Chloroflexota bacterium]
MQTNYRPALELAQKALLALDPSVVAKRSGADLLQVEGGQEYRLELLAREYRIPLPDALVCDASTGAEAGASTTLVLLHYLATADGSPVAREWIPFRSLPGGNVYEQAFRRQCLAPLVEAFGSNPEGLATAAEGLEGARSTMGDLSYTLQALPHLPMACILWLADEEQGAEASILFDAVAPRCLPTEDLAALGRMLAFDLVRFRGRKP